MRTKSSHHLFLMSNEPFEFNDNKFLDDGIKASNDHIVSFCLMESRQLFKSIHTVRNLCNSYQQTLHSSDKPFPKFMHIRECYTLDNGVRVLDKEYKCFEIDRHITYDYRINEVDSQCLSSSQVELFDEFEMRGVVLRDTSENENDY